MATKKKEAPNDALEDPAAVGKRGKTLATAGGKDPAWAFHQLVDGGYHLEHAGVNYSGTAEFMGAVARALHGNNDTRPIAVAVAGELGIELPVEIEIEVEADADAPEIEEVAGE